MLYFMTDRWRVLSASYMHVINKCETRFNRHA